jgi:hypothetical protein
VNAVEITVAGYFPGDQPQGCPLGAFTGMSAWFASVMRM